jgi:8-oxo-dGTP pyrophosphatase MutT (NUDIX family)
MRWKVLKSTEVFKSGLFKLRTDECQLPDGRVFPRYYVMEFLDWVNVVPVTSDGQMILVEQYRHAGDEVFLEIPGGSTDARGEDPQAAGARELREETGYESGEWVNCGFHFPNPALQSNRLHTFLALGCELTGEQDLDPFEDLQVRVRPVKEVFQLLERGEIKHSLIANSLWLSAPHLKAKGYL